MNTITRRVTFLLVVFLFVVPLLAGTDIANVRYAPDFSYVSDPAIASNGNHFLTLWEGRAFWNSYEHQHIYGAQSDTSGGSNSPALPVIPYSNGVQVTVIGTGSGYAAIWNEPYNGEPFFGRLTSEGILRRRVSLASAGINQPYFSKPALACNGSRVAIVDYAGGSIYISITDLDGNLLRRFMVTTDNSASYAVAVLGSDFVVMTAGNTGIIEWLVTNDGMEPAALRRILPPIAANTKRYAIAAAAKNGRVVAAWTESRYGETSGSLFSATIEPDGTVTQSSLPAADGAAPGSVVVLPVDLGYVIAWNVTPAAPAKPRVFALRLDNNGTSLDDHALLLSDGQFISAASSGNTIKFAFKTSTTLSYAIATVTAIVDAAGIAAQPAAPALSPVAQVAYAVTGNGAGFTAAWLENELEANQSRVVAGRVNTAGEPLDGTGIVLDVHALSAPVIAHSPSADLIVWTANGRLKATRLSASGGVLDSTPIDIAPLSSGAYDVAWNGHRFFVVWIGNYGSFSSAFVEPDGVATPGNDFSFPSNGMYPGTVNIAWDGREYIIVYKEFAPEYADATPTIADIRVSRVSAAGVVLDPVPAQINLGDSDNGLVHVASSGSESLIVFDRDSGPVSVVVHGRGATLQLDPEVPLLHWETGWSGVAWNGSAYVVAMRYVISSPYAAVWLSAIEVGQSGKPLRTITAAADGILDSSWYAPPTIATDPAAGMAFVTTDITQQAYVPRARIYLQSEFSPTAIPPAPPAPRNVVGYLSGTSARIEWQSDGASGFVIDRSRDFGATWSPAATAPADARTITITAKIGDLVRVRAFGPGGVSEGTITSIGSAPRRRAIR